MLDGALEHFALMLVDTIGLVDPQKVILYGFPFESTKFVDLLFSKTAKVDRGTVRTSIEKSKGNLVLDDLGCASIVIEGFLKNGAIFTPFSPGREEARQRAVGAATIERGIA